jgi:hypothetical protein
MTYDPKIDFKRIDWKKLKQFEREYLDAKHDWRWWYGKRQSAKCGSVTFPTPKGVGKHWTWEALTETTVYSLVSFLHGKQHLTRKRIPLCDASGGTEVVPFTKEMQDALVGDLWKDFLLPEPAVVAPEEPKVANG